jgi:hypothetical protein
MAPFVISVLYYKKYPRVKSCYCRDERRSESAADGTEDILWIAGSPALHDLQRLCHFRKVHLATVAVILLPSSAALMAHHMGIGTGRIGTWGQTHLLFSLCFFHDESRYFLTKKEERFWRTQWMEHTPGDVLVNPIPFYI